MKKEKKQNIVNNPFHKNPRKPKKPRNPKYFIQVVFMIGPPYVVRNKSRYVTNISQWIGMVIIVFSLLHNNSKRGNMLRNKEDNIVKWL